MKAFFFLAALAITTSSYASANIECKALERGGEMNVTVIEETAERYRANLETEDFDYNFTIREDGSIVGTIFSNKIDAYATFRIANPTPAGQAIKEQAYFSLNDTFAMFGCRYL